MIETLSVSLSGPAFSFLLCENLKSPLGQEGFLLGEITVKESSSITDNDQRQLHVARMIKINSCVPCPQTGYFYDGIGRVNFEKIKRLLGDLTSKVVAWYTYKPASSFNLTFRERIVHKQLPSLFEVSPEFFTCCLLISESSDNGSTHSFLQNFVRYNSHGYEQLPLHIVNLSDPNNSYKSPEPISEIFLGILNGLKINHKKMLGLTIITKIQNALQKHTSVIMENLSEKEKRLFQLENEVKKVKETLKTQRIYNSCNNDEAELNNLNSLDSTPEPIISEVSSNSSTPRKSTRAKGTPSATKAEKKREQSPTKRNNIEPRETRSRLRKVKM